MRYLSLRAKRLLSSQYWSLQARRFWRSRYLLIMMAFPFVYLFIFQYMPIYGAQIAFRNFTPLRGIWGSPWVGFDNFRQFFGSVFFFRLFRNTIVISVVQLAFTFPAAIVLALMINELRVKYLKKSVQTILYLPHFISVVVVAGLVVAILGPSGIVNSIIRFFGRDTVFFFIEPNYFPFILAFTDLWQSTGFNSIIYLAALSSIDPGLYEAAVMDGASRYQQIKKITLPCLVPTIVVLLILAMGNIFTVGFQRILLLYNPSIYYRADVIGTFVFRRGLGAQDFSYAAAVDMFNSVLNLGMIVFFNKFMRRIGETSLW